VKESDYLVKNAADESHKSDSNFLPIISF